MEEFFEDVPTEGTSSLSKARTLEAMAEFWDEHDLTEFDTDAPDVEFNVNPNLRVVRERGEK